MSSSSGSPDPISTRSASPNDFDPYQNWLGIPATEQPPNHYRLLGLELYESVVDVIESACRGQAGSLRRFAGGRHKDLAQKLFNEVAAARKCLLDPQSKLAYDTKLRQELSGPEIQAPIRDTSGKGWTDGQLPKNLDEFITCVAVGGLYTRSEMLDFIASLPPERRPTDHLALAKELVRCKKLTKHQASFLYNGRPFHLLFGQYEVTEWIGKGGMGLVYKARHRTMNRLSAIKVLSSTSLQSERAVERFRREVKVAASLSHPNIVATHDADEKDGELYLVMEFIEGRDIAAILKQQGPFPVDQLIDIIIQAARGLGYTHSQGIIHRDIKPGNLMLTSDGITKIADLGLGFSDAPLAGGDGEAAVRLTMPGQIVGTVDYMSPEQAVDTHSVDARSDIYSLGCTMYRMATGTIPYPAETPLKKLMAHQCSPIPMICAKRPDAPAALDEVFHKMVAKEPADRYQSMAEVVAALENVKRGVPLEPLMRPEPQPGASSGLGQAPGQGMRQPVSPGLAPKASVPPPLPNPPLVPAVAARRAPPPQSDADPLQPFPAASKGPVGQQGRPLAALPRRTAGWIPKVDAGVSASQLVFLATAVSGVLIMALAVVLVWLLKH